MAHVDQVIDQALANQKIVGTVILVAKDGELVYERAAGFADRENGQAVSVDTIFRLASVTKPMVAATILALIDAGRLALADPVSAYLPYFTPKTKEGETPDITIHHLLTHTSGLTYNPTPADQYAPEDQVNLGLPNTDLDIETNLRRLAKVPLAFAPGTAWEYGTSIDVLGAVVSAITGLTLEDAIVRHVANPLGMPDTRFHVVDMSRLAAAYGDGSPTPERMTEPFPLKGKDGNITVFSPERIFNARAFQSGGAGMAGTAPDFLKFLEAMRQDGGGIIKPETARLALANQIGRIERPTGSEGQKFSYLGAYVDDPSLQASPYSKGAVRWGGIYGHEWFIDPTRGISAALFTNTAYEGCNGDYPTDLTRAIYAQFA